MELFEWIEIEQPLQLYAVVEDGCCTVHTLSFWITCQRWDPGFGTFVDQAVLEEIS